MIVMKFGGTSVADAKAIRQVTRAVTDAASDQPVVVVSALGGFTDVLFGMARSARAGDRPAVAAALEAGRRRHLGVVADLDLGEQVAGIVSRQFDELALILDRPPSDAEATEFVDRVVGFGEVLSSHIVAAALRRGGLPAEWFDVGGVMITDARFGSAHPQLRLIEEAVRKRLHPVAQRGRIPVTQGYIGRTPDGRPTTLGRGGSDFSASILGAALPASRVEIWTDVDGLMTADPRIVPHARVLPRATYEESAELAAFGAKVLHPATQLPLVMAEIPIVIRNTFALDRPGTWIDAGEGEEGPGAVRSISFKPRSTVVNVRAPRMLGAYGFLRQLFEVFERHAIVVDVLASSEVSVSLTVDEAARLDGAAEELAAVGEVSIRTGRGVVAVVGRAIRDVPGIAARVYSAIPEVNVEMISQGASATNLTFIVKEEDGPGVVRALHRAFFEEEG